MRLFFSSSFYSSSSSSAAAAAAATSEHPLPKDVHAVNDSFANISFLSGSQGKI